MRDATSVSPSTIQPFARLVSCVVTGIVVLGLSGCAAGDSSGVTRSGPDAATEDTGLETSSSLWLSFDSTVLTYDGRRVFADEQGRSYVGRTRTAHGGAVELRPGETGQGKAVAFPAYCRKDVCPRALIEVENSEDLNPGTSGDFAYGASVLLQPNESSLGSNIVQKGRFGAPGGQWKLQVDTLDGFPSCVVENDGAAIRVRSRVTVADSVWHDVVCNASANKLEIIVDGEVEGKNGHIPPVTTDSPIRIGSPGLDQTDDQFHGVIDEVFVRIGGVE